jgi:hypothetical protein
MSARPSDCTFQGPLECLAGEQALQVSMPCSRIVIATFAQAGPGAPFSGMTSRGKLSSNTGMVIFADLQEMIVDIGPSRSGRAYITIFFGLPFGAFRTRQPTNSWSDRISGTKSPQSAQPLWRASKKPMNGLPLCGINSISVPSRGAWSIGSGGFFSARLFG